MQVKSVKRKGKYGQKITEAIIKDLMDGIDNYVPFAICAYAAGIGEGTLEDWMSQGKLDIADGEDTLYAKLARAISKSQKKRIKECTKDIKDSSRGHAGKQWLLSRAFWKYFSDNAQNLEMNERIEKLEKQRSNDDAVSEGKSSEN